MINKDLYNQVMKVLPSKMRDKIIRYSAHSCMVAMHNGYFEISIPDMVADLVFNRVEGWDSLSRKEIQDYITMRQEYLIKPHVYGE